MITFQEENFTSTTSGKDKRWSLVRFFISQSVSSMYFKFYLTDPSEMLTHSLAQNKVSVWLWVFMSSYPLPNKWSQDAKNLRVFYFVWTCYFQPIWRFFPIMFLMQFPSWTMSTAILWLLYTLFMILGGQNGAITQDLPELSRNFSVSEWEQEVWGTVWWFWRFQQH
jgi:hypothetical protein